jgi:hypothetical protein
MKQLEIGGVQLEIDVERTKSLYKRPPFPMGERCQCEGCMDARLSRSLLPQAQLEFLQDLGIDPWLNVGGDYVGPPCPDSHGRGRRNLMYYAYGRVAEETPKLFFDRQSWLWVDKVETKWERFHRQLNLHDVDLKDFIFVRTSSLIPPMHDHVTTVRLIRYSSPCPKCGRKTNYRAFLKRKGRLPEILGLPELRSQLHNRSSRVLGTFCYQCGHFQYEVVPDKPPFWRRVKEERPQLAGPRRWRIYKTSGSEQAENPKWVEYRLFPLSGTRVEE